jgi:hypothetical protein
MEAPAPDPHPEAPGIWPGSTDFANALGRLRVGAITLFELDTAVPREVSRVILGPMIIHALRVGGRVLILPPPSLDLEDSYVSLQRHVRPEIIRARLRVLSSLSTSDDARELPDSFLPFDKVGWTKTGMPTPVPVDAEFLRAAEGSTGPNLIVAYMSGIEALTEAAGVGLIRGIVSRLAKTVFPRNPVHVAAVGRVGDSLFEGVGAMSEIMVRVRCPHGRIFINGHRPYLAPMVLSQEPGSEPYRLTTVL